MDKFWSIFQNNTRHLPANNEPSMKDLSGNEEDIFKENKDERINWEQGESLGLNSLHSSQYHPVSFHMNRLDAFWLSHLSSMAHQIR